MQTIHKEISFDKTDGKKKAPSPKEEDVYVNTKDWQPKTKKCTELRNKKTGKIFISVLVLLLMLGALTMCAIGIFYHNKVVSYELLNKKYADIAATLIVMQYKVNETERLNEELKVKFQQVQEDLSACSAIQKGRQCEEGWTYNDLKCYYFSTFKLNWIQSRDECVGKGGHLVVITSRAEQNFISSQIKKTHWIGLNDLETKGKWIWVNNQETSVTFWNRSPEGIEEPNNWTKEDPSGENCVALGNEDGHTNKWFDASCRKQKQFICEN